MILLAATSWMRLQPIALAQDDEPAHPVASDADLEMAPQVGAAATLLFRAAVETSRPRLFLGDVATCNGMAEICDEAYGVDLGPSPEPGRTQMLRLEQLKPILAEEWPDADLRLAGPKMIKVMSTAAAVGDEAIAKALKETLAGLFPSDGDFAVDVERVLVPPTLKLRPGEQRLEFPGLTADRAKNLGWVRKALTGNVHLAVVALAKADGDDEEGEAAERSTFTITARLILKEKLPVPLHDLVKGDVLGDADLGEQLVEVPHGSQVIIAAADQLIGRRVKRAVSAYTPMTEAMIEVPKVVHRGQLVHLVMHASGLQVSSQVVAQADAGYGQQIEAVYPATKKRLRVRVVDSSTVEYVF